MDMAHLLSGRWEGVGASQRGEVKNATKPRVGQDGRNKIAMGSTKWGGDFRPQAGYMGAA